MLVLAVASCCAGGCADDAGVDGHPEGAMEAVASFKSEDDISLEHIRRVLSKAEIRMEFSGSLEATVQVPRGDAGEARRLIQREAGLFEYVSIHTDVVQQGRAGQIHERQWEHPVEIEQSVGDLYRTHPASTVVGKIVQAALRGYISDEADQLVIGVVEWTRRPFVTRELRPSYAIEAVVGVHGRDGSVLLDASIMPK